MGSLPSSISKPATSARIVGPSGITFYWEREMAAMMILMAVLLVVPGPGGHMGLHGGNASPGHASQSLERDAAKADTAAP